MVEGLYAQGVAGEDGVVGVGVEEEEAVHASEFGDGLGAPGDERMEEGFGVAVGSELTALGCELGAEVVVVVELAVVGEDVPVVY